MAHFVVGIAGGIGSGKTAVSDRLGHFGITIVDADVVARAVVEPGQDCLAAIAEHFGDGVIGQDGRLDRAVLRERIFKNDDDRRALERLTHPAINRLIAEQLGAAPSPYAVLVNPLMRAADPRAHRILVVDVPEGVQVRRTMARDGVSEAQVRAILASQTSRETRLSFADDIVTNDGSLEDLHAAVDSLHQRYLEFAND